MEIQVLENRREESFVISKLLLQYGHLPTKSSICIGFPAELGLILVLKGMIRLVSIVSLLYVYYCLNF